MVVKIQVMDFWVVTPCSVVVWCRPLYLHLHPEDGGSRVMWNLGILLQHYTVSQPKSPWLRFSHICFILLKHFSLCSESWLI